MDRLDLQRKIDTCTGAEDMVEIAREYLDGTVIRDVVAAEAWLLKAIDSQDPIHGIRAMGIMAREILGKSSTLLESEISDLQARVINAAGQEKAELEELLHLV